MWGEWYVMYPLIFAAGLLIGRLTYGWVKAFRKGMRAAERVRKDL